MKRYSLFARHNMEGADGSSLIHRVLAFFIFGCILTLYFRLTWVYSLSNGDELLFATLKGATPPGTIRLQQLPDFFYYLWSVHNGRTADWLSALIYLNGFSTGKWVTSLITGFSISLIAFSIERILSFYVKNSAKSLWYTLTAILVSIFAVVGPAHHQAAYVSNLLVYSAAITNYLVFVSLITWAWAIGLTTKSEKTWVALCIIVFLIGTAHEQAALAGITLAAGIALLRRKDIPIKWLASLPLSATLGAVEIFISPGFRNKINRVNPEVTEFSGIIQKAKQSLRALYIQLDEHILLLLFLGISGLILIWLYSIHDSSSAKPSPRATILLLALVAVSTMSIPMASGTGQIRVFNYPIMLAGIASGTAIFLGILLCRHLKIRFFILTIVTFCILTISGGALLQTYNSQFKNYSEGYTQLIKQINNCPSDSCILEDLENLPVKHGFSGYGEHEYTRTDYIELWLK